MCVHSGGCKPVFGCFVTVCGCFWGVGVSGCGGLTAVCGFWVIFGFGFGFRSCIRRVLGRLVFQIRGVRLVLLLLVVLFVMLMPLLASIGLRLGQILLLGVSCSLGRVLCWVFRGQG